jgi:plastocyanin
MESGMTVRLRQITAAAAIVFVASCGGGSDGATTTEPVDNAVDNTVANVSVTGTAVIAPGGSSQLTALAKNAAGSPLTGMSATWSSSVTSVATVNGSGLVTALANGTTMITATVSGKPGLLQISVQTVTFSSSATVTAQGSAFAPSQVDIAAGGTVTWAFADPIDHTVDFAGSGAPANIPASNSKSVERTFTAAGTYQYNCAIHYGMSGTVIVH